MNTDKLYGQGHSGVMSLADARMQNVRAQMGHVHEAAPFGIYRLSRDVMLQMVASYGDNWSKDRDMLEMAYLIIALQLRRCGVSSEGRLDLDGTPRLFLPQWLLKVGPRVILHPCLATSARRRFGKPLFTAVDVAYVFVWAKEHGIDPTQAPVLSDHLCNRERAHASVITSKTVQTRRVL